MIDIILSLALSMPLLILMIYPSMKIADWLSSRYTISKSLDDKLTIILTIILSIVIGSLLHFT
jgi:hypothetical protein